MDAWHTLDVNDPLELFCLWLKEAEASEPNDANAAALATSTLDGHPSVRMVLVKRADERGFCFFTNAESKKGIQLQSNPRAALCFHWKTLRRQVRVEGRVTEMEAADVDEYFHSRSRNSQISAAVSQQSRPLGSREATTSGRSPWNVASVPQHRAGLPRPADTGRMPPPGSTRASSAAPGAGPSVKPLRGKTARYSLWRKERSRKRRPRPRRRRPCSRRPGSPKVSPTSTGSGG